MADPEAPAQGEGGAQDTMPPLSPETSHLIVAEMEEHMTGLEVAAAVWDKVAEVHLKELQQMQSKALSVARARFQRAEEAKEQADMAQRQAQAACWQAKEELDESRTSLLAIDSIYREAVSMAASEKLKRRSEADAKIQAAQASWDDARQQLLAHGTLSNGEGV